MKKWLCLTAAFLAIGLLSRLPHPAQDIAKLDPVRAVYIDIEDDLLHIQIDTGEQGSGYTLTAAETDLRANSEKEVYLDTAEFLILDPDVPLTEEFFALFSPACHVSYSDTEPDISAAAEYLSLHTPDLRLNHLRAQKGAQ